MLKIFKDVEKQKLELEQLVIYVQTDEIMHRQKNEIEFANRLKVLENSLRMAIKNIEDGLQLK